MKTTALTPQQLDAAEENDKKKYLELLQVQFNYTQG